ncbi:GlsB/YeaQ/YmgE family stress response membrane protein [Paractinoplanes rishiriensis]|uniref:Transglycosylase associated protein n=1 Tax=Paractinoplanes rishiriensis TaxID=1050105 RepID=A0A919MVC3_9ACTN|nr:GlsB/YeaQ/YmgE family stress response membrane protein [Actinoplanes rishiriensis]GIF01257.1 hypothetical protein Ari01nite_87210 [Actinoplanes rishiriensis]
MTITHLIAAVAVGTAVGIAGRLIMPPRRRVPVWLPVAVGIGAALLGTVVARLADSDSSGFSIAELTTQLTFAALGIAWVAATADRQPMDSASQDHAGRSR